MDAPLSDTKMQPSSVHQQPPPLQHNQAQGGPPAAGPAPPSSLPSLFSPPPPSSPTTFPHDPPACPVLDDIETGHKLQAPLHNSSSNDGSPSPHSKLWSAHTSQAQLLDAADPAPCHVLSTALDGRKEPRQVNHQPQPQQLQLQPSHPKPGCRWWSSWASTSRWSQGQGQGPRDQASANGLNHVAAGSICGRADRRQLPTAPAMVRSRVEPKTFFAAERTFLAWMNIAVLVMFASFSLISSISSFRTEVSGAGASGTPAAAAGASACGGNSMCMASMVTGLALAPVAMCLMVYALYMYRTRSQRILRREMVRYDDQRGPLFLTLLLIVVVTVSYALQVRSTS